MGCNWDKVTLGRTGLSVSPLGLGSSYGLIAEDIEYAFERGINYFYWGSSRRDSFGEGIRRVSKRSRDRVVVVVQTYTRAAMLMESSLDSALRDLDTSYADVLLLGWWNQRPPGRILDAALELRERGKIRHIAISCHHRPSFQTYIHDPIFGVIMVRYSAAHAGAEQEVFPVLDPLAMQERPGVVAYTATRWRALLDPKFVPEGDRPLRASDCYRFALSSPFVNVVLSGPANRAELDEAFAALDRGPLDDEENAWLRRIGANVRSRSKGTGTFHPMNVIDRVQRWIDGF